MNHLIPFSIKFVSSPVWFNLLGAHKSPWSLLDWWNWSIKMKREHLGSFSANSSSLLERVPFLVWLKRLLGASQEAVLLGASKCRLILASSSEWSPPAVSHSCWFYLLSGMPLFLPPFRPCLGMKCWAVLWRAFGSPLISFLPLSRSDSRLVHIDLSESWASGLRCFAFSSAPMPDLGCEGRLQAESGP